MAACTQAIYLLEGVLKKVQNLKPVLKICGDIALKSIDKNFTVEGRPIRWKPSKRVKKFGGKTLQISKRLKNSPKQKVARRKTTIFTKVVYAAIHNYGGSITTSRGTFYMPRRRFFMLQNTDIKVMKKEIYKYCST